MKPKRSSGTTIGQTLAYLSLGFMAAFLEDLWPERRAVTQMLLFSVMVFAPMCLFLWESRRIRLLQYGFVGMALVHSGILRSYHSSFPFRSIWSIVPIAICESIALAALGLFLVNMADRRAKIAL